MKMYLIILPFIITIFTYTIYYQIYDSQNIDVNNGITNALYSSIEMGSLKSYSQDIINEEKLIYEIINNLSLESANTYPTEVQLDFVSYEPYMIEVTYIQYLNDGNSTEISRIFIIDNKH